MPEKLKTETLNGKTWVRKQGLGYREAFVKDPIPGAAFIDRNRFEAAVQACVMAATLAMEIKGKRDKTKIYPTAGLAPDFWQVCWEVRGALARACKRELYIIGWEELTPKSGTPGLERRPNAKRGDMEAGGRGSQQDA